MQLLIRGDKVKVTDAIHDYVTEKVTRLEKYLEDQDNIRATVVLKIRDHRQKVEVTIPLKSLILRAEEETDDLYTSIDNVVEKLERQIRKNKTKLQKNLTKGNKEFIFAEMEEIVSEPEQIVKRKKVEIKPMNEEEAILQMDLLGHQFYLYQDADTNSSAVVYKRKDGGYGVIEGE